jgi:hypothetical protein
VNGAVDHEKNLAAMAKITDVFDAFRETYTFDALRREDLLGLEYREGEVVYDPGTDQRGEVLASTRRRVVEV